MDPLKFVVVLVAVVLVQVFGALGTPLSGEDGDHDIWNVDNWQIWKKSLKWTLEDDNRKGKSL
ncbi:hypothetical protein EXN66_Car015330 [Channa argus]|uniref:Uncharacterized protein n=1 Tax=Channa argus TaxID=215402 RepID=A0A6G1QBD7_CHAAH|nr:hypothetical protein EXN66_Car015330 [Channa argus]